MADQGRPSYPQLNGFQQAAAITKSDTAILVPTGALYIGDGSAVSIVVRMTGDVSGTNTTFANVQPGTLLPVSVVQVLSATTATNVIGLW